METVFLATTAIEDFWDTSKPIVFLGEWCKRFSRKSFWGKLNGRMVADPWSQKGKVEASQRPLRALYEKILPVLARSLNHLHGLQASNRYWRILLGVWLRDYLSVVHDRYVTLLTASSQFPNFSTILLAEESFIIPSDSHEFCWLSSEDTYNLQVYTKILSFWGERFPRKSLKIRANLLYIKEESLLEKMRIKGVLKFAFRAIEKRLKNAPIIFENSYFSHLALIQLFLRTRGRFWSFFQDQPPPAQCSPEMEKRAQIRHDLQYSCASEFERLLASTLPSDIPQKFVEGFKLLCDESSRIYPSRPKLIFSANAWFYQDPFKQWAAQQAEQGVPLVGSQHGGNYGSLLYHPTEEYELEILDRFYSWGWKNGSPKIKPFFASKLAARKKIPVNRKEKNILFVTTSLPRYPFSGCTIPTTSFADYFSWQSRFLNSLPSALRQQARLRPHYVDYGWDISERWKETFPDMVIESWSTPFIKSLEKCRLYVCDHLSTTFIESLVLEKPSLLFWDFDANPLRPEAQPFYDALVSVGILHRSPESASRHLVSVYEDVTSWWDHPECRRVRAEFCRQFGRTSPNAVQEWADEIKSWN